MMPLTGKLVEEARKNLEFFKNNILNLKEVSIGHALISESLYFGLESTIKSYLKILN